VRRRQPAGLTRWALPGHTGLPVTRYTVCATWALWCHPSDCTVRWERSSMVAFSREDNATRPGHDAGLRSAKRGDAALHNDPGGQWQRQRHDFACARIAASALGRSLAAPARDNAVALAELHSDFSTGISGWALPGGVSQRRWNHPVRLDHVGTPPPRRPSLVMLLMGTWPPPVRLTAVPLPPPHREYTGVESLPMLSQPPAPVFA